MTNNEDQGADLGHRTLADMFIMPGTVLGEKYEIDEIIGEGGMGIIARAVNVDLHTTVAVKVLQPRLLNDEVALARFLREARGVSKLSSPHIVRMLDVNSHPPDPPFMVMELLSGEDLDTMVQRRGKLPPEFVVELMLQACSGVAVAHAAGILHRDLKPANLFLARNDDGTCVLKLLDFGLMRGSPKNDSKLTHPNDVFGSPSFMSPEQIAGEVVDERTDIWALGAILFELLTGTPAFGADSIPQTLVNVATREPPLVSTISPAVTPELEAIVSRCLSKDRSARFLDIAELKAALEPLRVPVDLPTLLTGAVIGKPVVDSAEAAAARHLPTEPELAAHVGRPSPRPIPAARPSPSPRRMKAALEESPSDISIPGVPKKGKRRGGILLLALFGALVGGIVGLVAYGSRADDPTTAHPPVNPSASVQNTLTAAAPPPTTATAQSTPGESIASLPLAPTAPPRNTRPVITSAPSAPIAPVSAAPVAAPPPTPAKPPPAAPSTDPYPECGRRK